MTVLKVQKKEFRDFVNLLYVKYKEVSFAALFMAEGTMRHLHWGGLFGPDFRLIRGFQRQVAALV